VRTDLASSSEEEEEEEELLVVGPHSLTILNEDVE